MNFPSLLVPTYSWRVEVDYEEGDAYLHEPHSKECECSWCCYTESEEAE